MERRVLRTPVKRMIKVRRLLMRNRNQNRNLRRWIHLRGNGRGVHNREILSSDRVLMSTGPTAWSRIGGFYGGYLDDLQMLFNEILGSNNWTQKICLPLTRGTRRILEISWRRLEDHLLLCIINLRYTISNTIRIKWFCIGVFTENME